MKYRHLLIPLFLFVVCISLFSSMNTPQVEAYIISESRVIECSTSDGHFSLGSGTWATARDTPSTTPVNDTDSHWAGTSLVTGTYFISRACLFFYTAILPSDANITSAILSVNLKTDNSVEDFNMTIQSGMPTYPHDPIISTDYNRVHYSGDGGQRNSSTCPAVDNYWNITLTSLGKSWINTAGWTKLMLRGSNDVLDDPPTDLAELLLYATEAGTNRCPRLYVSYTITSAYLFRLYGAYDENGNRDGNISVSFFRPTQERLDFTLDGQYNCTSEADTRMVFEFDLGNNESRVFFVGDTTYRDIYVFKPTPPYYTYYFSVIDYVGISNGYLETMLNINGTDRVVERWRLDVLNDIPFTLSWGVAYTVRIVCDQGSYVYGMYVAEATTSFTLVVTSSMFAETATHTGNITISAGRPQADTIQLNYTDAANETQWVNVQIYTIHGTSAVYSTNNTGNVHQISWGNADTETDYRVAVTARHQIRETLTWQFTLAAPETYTNPWDLSVLGEFPIDSSQILGMIIVSLCFAAGHTKNAASSIVLGLIVAAILTVINWLAISWAWLSVSFAVGLICVVSIQKDRRRSEQ